MSKPDRPDNEEIPIEEVPIPEEEIPTSDTKVDKEEVKPEVVKGEITEKNKDRFIPEIGELIKKSEEEKYITITINKKMLHFFQEGLTTYRGKFSEDTEGNAVEREQIDKIIDELAEVKAVLNEEVIVKTKGTQEPNPVEMTEGVPEPT